MDLCGPSPNNLTTLKKLFEKSAEIIFHEFMFDQNKVILIKCDGMVDQQLLYSVVLPNIEILYKDKNNVQKITEQAIEKLPIPELKKVTSKDDVITEVYSGSILICFEDAQLLYTCNIASKPNRKPEETNMEVLVKGPRDNFIEDLPVNIALIRKRLPTNSLCVEKFQIGRRSKTQVAILYMDDIANKDILAELNKEFKKIDIDIVASATSLMEFINKKTGYSPLPIQQVGLISQYNP